MKLKLFQAAAIALLVPLIVVGVFLLVTIFVLDQTVGRLTIGGHSVSTHVFHPVLDFIIDTCESIITYAESRERLLGQNHPGA